MGCRSLAPPMWGLQRQVRRLAPVVVVDVVSGVSGVSGCT